MSLDQATISPNSGPSYDDAHLKELKASTPTSRPVIADPYDADMSMDVEDTPMTSDASMSLSGRLFCVHSVLTLTPKLATHEAIIPSETSISAAKERRGLLRKTGVSGEEEFVSLSVVRRADEYQGPHPESRLMREEDDLGEGDDGLCFPLLPGID